MSFGKGVGVVALLTVAFNVQLMFGQSAQQESSKNDPHLAAGRLVARGEGRTPIGRDRLLTYKLEEVALQDPLDFEIRGKRHHLTTVLRLTITSESIQGAHVIWIDDASLPAVFGLGEHAIGVLIYDRSILKDGAVISVSDHLGRNLFDLPERLKLPESLKAAIKPAVVQPGNTYRVYSSLRVAGSERQRFINFEFTTSWGFEILNLSYIVQIGKKFFVAGTSGFQATISLTPEEFAQLKDGEMIAIGYGGPILNHSSGALWEFGPLDKSRLDR